VLRTQCLIRIGHLKERGIAFVTQYATVKTLITYVLSCSNYFFYCCRTLALEKQPVTVIVHERDTILVHDVIVKERISCADCEASTIRHS
jgi:hypothetical protein